jgi:hypothetical protein
MQNLEERESIKMVLKKGGVDTDKEDKIVFILNSRDNFIRRAALKRGWHENGLVQSTLFDIKWDYTDTQNEGSQLKPH